jgi:hypothetical protein
VLEEQQRAVVDAGRTGAEPAIVAERVAFLFDEPLDRKSVV